MLASFQAISSCNFIFATVSCQICALECSRASASEVWFHSTAEPVQFPDDGTGGRAAGDTAGWSLHMWRVGICTQTPFALCISCLHTTRVCSDAVYFL